MRVNRRQSLANASLLPILSVFWEQKALEKLSRMRALNCQVQAMHGMAHWKRIRVCDGRESERSSPKHATRREAVGEVVGEAGRGCN